MTSFVLAPKTFSMKRTFGTPPTAIEIDVIARAALARMPMQFAAHLGDIILQVEEFADEETLEALEINDPFALTGVYEGLPLPERSIDHAGSIPDRIRLFRAAILDEWIASAAEGEEGESLEHLVTHVLVHEIGHHFGLSDEDMRALEEMAAGGVEICNVQVPIRRVAP